MVQGLVRTRAVTAEGPGSTLVGELRSHRLCSVAKASKQASKQARKKPKGTILFMVSIKSGRSRDGEM